MPLLNHPDLPGVEIDVDEAKARNRRKAGWVDASPEPPAGNASTDEWRAYAVSLGVEVAEDAGREDIKQAVADHG